MAGPEKKFENQVKDFLKKEGAWFLKYWGGGGFTTAGIPDILACVNGVFVAIEVKAANGKPSVLQIHTIDEIMASGGVAMVLYPKDFDRFKKLIQTIKEHQTNDYSKLWGYGVIQARCK